MSTENLNPYALPLHAHCNRFLVCSCTSLTSCLRDFYLNSMGTPPSALVCRRWQENLVQLESRPLVRDVLEDVGIDISQKRIDTLLFEWLVHTGGEHAGEWSQWGRRQEDYPTKKSDVTGGERARLRRTLTFIYGKRGKIGTGLAMRRPLVRSEPLKVRCIYEQEIV